MSALESSEKKKTDNSTTAEMPYAANCAENLVREKLSLVFGTLLVLSLQFVFRATAMARHWNY
jgi:hypothetical protein